jgi:hypothetical protein
VIAEDAPVDFEHVQMSVVEPRGLLVQTFAEPHRGIITTINPIR